MITFVAILAAAAVAYAFWTRHELATVMRTLSLVRDREQRLDVLSTPEARAARALRGTSDGLWDLDLRSGELYVSPAWLHMLGLASSEVDNIQSGFFDRLHPDDAARARGRLESHLRVGTPYDLELRLRHRDGTYRWVWARGEAERDAEGQPIRMSGAVTDISARRAVEEVLLRTDRILRVRSACNLALVRAETEDELLQAVCDLAVREGGYKMAWVGIAEHDARRRVRPVASCGDGGGYVAAAAVTWGDDETGRGPAGRCIRSGEPQTAQDIALENAFSLWREAALARGYASVCSIPLRAGASPVGAPSSAPFAALTLYSGERYAFDAEEVRLLMELANDLSFGIGAIRDHRALSEGQAQLALFRQVLDRSNDAVFIADATTGRFVDFNETAARQLGYSRDELLALGLTDVVPRLQDERDLRETIRRTSGADDPVSRSTHRRKDGTEFSVEVARTRIETGGRRLLLGIARDISERQGAETEREALQQKLLQSQKMESVGRLAGGVAHDFNNLLTVINTTADLVLSELEPNAPMRTDLQEIRAAGDRAADLTRQLLAFSRQQVMRREVLSLNDLVSDFLKMLRRLIGEDIVVDVRPGADRPSVIADRGQLGQVLMNLCVNARDAMPGGGTLTISTSTVSIDATHAARHATMQPGPHVLLAVSDSGEGMPAETQAHIFEPFFTTKESGKGTGLGLSTVYGIVKQSGGSIWVYSEPGHGTTFKVYLPLAQREAPERRPPAIASQVSGSETILVVEDEPAIRTVVRRMLERAGYRVIEAASGEEALERIAENKGPLDLVMTDLVMPGMSGAELAQQLRRERPSLRILLTSGYSAEAVAGRFTGAERWRLISKPYTVSDLLHEVREALDE